jgi:hypothetical protein
MNEATYCQHVYPGTLIAPEVRAVPGLHGISSAITIALGLETKKYSQMLEEMTILRGELHKTKIHGHEDSGYAASVVRQIQMEDSGPPRSRIPTPQMTHDLSMAAMSRSVTFLMWLKNRGDEYLMQDMYSTACMWYANVHNLETFWLQTSPLPAEEIYWTERSRMFTAFGVALAINLAIAHMAGGDGHRFGAVRVRGTQINFHFGAMFLCSAGGSTLMPRRLMELTIVVVLYNILVQNCAHSGYISNLEFIRKTWEEEHGQDNSLNLSLGLDPVYKTVKRLLGPNNDEISISEGMGELKFAARSVATVAPLKWALSEDMFSPDIQHDLSFLAKVKFLPGEIVESEGYDFEIPGFDEPPDDVGENGEDGMRYLM